MKTLLAIIGALSLLSLLVVVAAFFGAVGGAYVAITAGEEVVVELTKDKDGQATAYKVGRQTGTGYESIEICIDPDSTTWLDAEKKLVKIVGQPSNGKLGVVKCSGVHSSVRNMLETNGWICVPQ